MENQRQVVCAENEELAAFLWKKRQEIADSPKGISENIDFTLHKAHFSICNSKTHIKTLKDLAQIKGVGKWILKLMQGFFNTDPGASESEDLTKKGKKNKGTKRYIPQKNSVAYALLITLYRGTSNGNEFMRKQDLIDAADAGGLSRAPIMPEKAKGKPGQFGNSPRDWYSGWSCMKTLITKGLVVKSSCPAKYMLTEEGKESARECLSRSGLAKSFDGVPSVERSLNVDQSHQTDQEFARSNSLEEIAALEVRSSAQEKSVDVPPESLNRFLRMGYFKEQILFAYSDVSKSLPHKDMSSLWPAVLCRLRETEVYGSHLESQNTLREDPPKLSTIYEPRYGLVDLSTSETRVMSSAYDGASYFTKSGNLHDSSQIAYSMRACSSSDNRVHKQHKYGSETKSNVLTMPPLAFGESFEDVYDVILILDDREKFTTQGPKSRKIIEHICTQFKIQIEVRRLPVGDAIWIARHKHFGGEYVLDFIVERKKVDDLRSSIRDNRYRDQKVRLLRCGLKKMIYVVEGDLNASDAAESIKTACFTTEILEGFDVQRTSGLADTLRNYGYLTQAIIQYYRSVNIVDKKNNPGICPPFNEFIKRCQDLDKMTISDVFAIQLMQVPQVTEEVAIAVLDLYPTLLSLVRAYCLLDGDISAQEEMLKKQSNSLINGVASRNIFQLIWGG